MAVLPTTGLVPETIDLGLDSSKKGLNLTGSGSIGNTRSTTNSSRFNSILDVSGPGIANKKSVITDTAGGGLKNNADSNSGVDVLPPAGNTETIVFASVKDFYEFRSDANFLQKENGVFVLPTSVLKEFYNSKERFILQVDTVRYLKVGNILQSQDGLMKGEIVEIIAPNKVYAVWIKVENEPKPLKILEYRKRNKWSILKKPLGPSSGLNPIREGNSVRISL